MEQCNTFTYLGVVFTTRLSAAKHVDHMLSKANARVGLLFAQLPLKSVPLNVAISLFNIYILPILTYCSSVWVPNLCESSRTKINSLYTKFLKRYLGVPYSVHNSLVHFVTGTIPLSYTLQHFARKSFYKIQYPAGVEGIQFSVPSEVIEEYDQMSCIPSYFWLSRQMDGDRPLPINPDSRRALIYELFDLFHPHICTKEEFHVHSDAECLCKLCGESAQRYHFRECAALSSLSPCAIMRKLEIG